MQLPFHHVDVFTERPLYGNPLAVYLDADNLDPELMQKIAREMNLSETTFVQRSADPACAFRVRIFTPGIELPFAGHPTVGTAFVLTRQKMITDAAFAFQMHVGPVKVCRQGVMFWIVPPQPKVQRCLEATAIAAALNLSAQSCVGAYLMGYGSRFLAVLLAAQDDVDRARPDRRLLSKVAADLEDVDILLFSYANAQAYSRMLPNPEYGIIEDPATGSSVAPLCLTLKLCNRLAPETTDVRIEQGAKIGRRSFLRARFAQTDNGLRNIEVGGTAVHLFESILTV